MKGKLTMNNLIYLLLEEMNKNKEFYNVDLFIESLYDFYINTNNFNNKIEDLKLKKKNILQKNNIPDNYLKPNYECKICKDTGYYLNNNYRTLMCNCLRQRILNISYNKSNLSDLKKCRFRGLK